MTLKITRFFTDALEKQAKISHFDFKLTFNSPEKINTSWKEKIKDQFGELFLNDANYIVACKVNDAVQPDADDSDKVDEAEGTDAKIIKKFTDLLTTVFGTEVPKSDVKELENYLIVKITTK